MRIYSKQINIAALFFLILYFLPVAVVQAENEKNAGELDIKMNRILEERGNQENTETELDRTFPELFQEETTDKIERTQEAKEKDINELQQHLFSEQHQEYSLLEETKDMLFTSDYSVTKVASSEETNEQQSSWTNQLLVAGLIAFVCVVLGGCFTLVRKLAG